MRKVNIRSIHPVVDINLYVPHLAGVTDALNIMNKHSELEEQAKIIEDLENKLEQLKEVHHSTKQQLYKSVQFIYTDKEIEDGRRAYIKAAYSE